MNKLEFITVTVSVAKQDKDNFQVKASMTPKSDEVDPQVLMVTAAALQKMAQHLLDKGGQKAINETLDSDKPKKKKAKRK